MIIIKSFLFSVISTAIQLIATQTIRLDDRLVNSVMIPRVSGSVGNQRIRQLIKNELTKAGVQNIQADSFTASTPNGNVQFENVIGRLDGQSCETIVLAAHLDSKKTSRSGRQVERFVGMTDSAVPVAMLLHLARLWAPQYFHSSKKPNYSLEFIFFDGEEAFREWSLTDSLYGSRHLASKWSKSDSTLPNCKKRNRLESIKLFILLDLIGSSGPTFQSYYADTHKYYRQMASLQNGNKYFIPGLRNSGSGIDDDHKPFERHGVPIIHLISNPFPAVWHRQEDNWSAYDPRSSSEILTVLHQFLGQNLF